MVLQIWQKKMKKLTCMTFLCLIALRNKTVAHRSPYSLYLSCIIWRCKCCLCQERLLWSRNLATILYLTSHFSSLLLYTHHKISIVTCNKEIIVMSNRPFYQHGGHIEFIRLKEYYGMPRWHSLSIYTGFLGKMRTSMIVYRQKGDHYYIQTRHNDLFFPLQSFSRKTWRKSGPKSA